MAQEDVGGPRLAAAVFAAGGVFFTTSGYSSVLLVANAGGGKWRWWSNEPGRLEWASAVALFVGTLYFGASLLAALIGDLTTAQVDRLVWSPEIIGCVLFLLSGHLALIQLRRERRHDRPPTSAGGSRSSTRPARRSSWPLRSPPSSAPPSGDELN